MGLEKLIVGQMTGAAASAFKMDIRLAELREKAIDKIASNIEDQIPIPLPFDTREALNGNPLPPNLLTPEILSQAQEIPESTNRRAIELYYYYKKPTSRFIKYTY